MLMSLILFLHQPAHSIRLVLSGGGVAEMMALTSLTQVSAMLVMISSQSEGEMHLSDEERNRIQHLAFRPELRPGYFELEFELNKKAKRLNNETEDLLYEKPNRIFVRDRDLYDEQYQPKSFNEISRIIFDSLIQHPILVNLLTELSLLHLDWSLLSSQIYDRINPKIEYTYLGQTDMQLVAFNTGSTTGRHIQSLLWLQKKDENIDLTGNVTAAVNCHSHPTLFQIGRFRLRQQVAVGNLNWVCGGTAYSGVISLPLAQLVKGETMEFRISQVDEILNFSEDCNQVLSGL